MKKRKIEWSKIMYIFVLVSFIAPLGFLTYKIATTSNISAEADADGRVKSDYVLMMLQCVLGIIALLLPSALTKRFKLEIPNHMYYLYLIFLYGAIFLGEVRDFYYKYDYWDLLMHTLSGIMIGFFGFSIVQILNQSNENVQLNAFFVAFFAFCFAMTLGGIWEIYEFMSDGILKTNMQKYALQSGIKLIGRDALIDTMEDIIVDGVGALVASTIGYFSIKYDKRVLSSLIIKMNVKKTPTQAETKDNVGTDETAHLKK